MAYGQKRNINSAIRCGKSNQDRHNARSIRSIERCQPCSTCGLLRYWIVLDGETSVTTEENQYFKALPNVEDLKKLITTNEDSV